LVGVSHLSGNSFVPLLAQTQTKTTQCVRMRDLEEKVSGTVAYCTDLLLYFPKAHSRKREREREFTSLLHHRHTHSTSNVQTEGERERLFTRQLHYCILRCMVVVICW